MGKEGLQYQEVVTEFLSMVRFGKTGSINGFLPKGDWHLIGDIAPSKMTAGSDSRGLFLKMYPPSCRFSAGYTQRVWETFQELGQLTDLQLPILTPLELHEGVLVFPKGEFKYNLHFSNLDQVTQAKISEVVEKNGLSPLSFMNDIEIISVHGIDYLSDPFDDSITKIEMFAKGTGKVS